MDFAIHYTPAQLRFRKEVRDWIADTLPTELHGSREHSESAECYALRRAFGRALGERGWLYPLAPQEFGGGGMDADSAMVLVEELNGHGLGAPPYYDSGGALGSVAILVWGTPEQKERLLPPIYRGEKRSWQLLTEPGAGSDVAAVSTTAVRDGDEYVLTGEKVYIGSAHGADSFWALVRTGPADARHENLSWFLFDADLPGISIEPMHLLGASDKSSIRLEGVRVPADNLVGGENQGWVVASTHLELEHGLRSDHFIGERIGHAWDALVEQCREPDACGRKPVDSEWVQEQLVQAYIRKESVRLLGIRNFWLSIGERERTYEGPQAYLLEKLTAQWLGHLAVETLGRRALMRTESASSKVLLGQQTAATLGMHGGGTAEIQKLIIARRLGLGRENRERAGRLA